MKKPFKHLSTFLKSATSRQELEQAKQQIEQARQRNRALERRLERTKQQLEQARQQNKKLRQRLDQAKQTRPQSKQSARENLLHMMPKGSVCAEIGVDRGDFSKRILEIVQPEYLHLIDPWKHEEETRYRESRYGGLGSGGQAIMDQRYHEVRERFDEEIRAGQVLVHRSYSDVASEEFEDSCFDWIYIDGNHLYEFVRNDLELYYPKVKVNGYITGDDYGAQDSWWENGVQEAVNEFVSQWPELTLEISGRQFVIKKGG